MAGGIIAIKMPKWGMGMKNGTLVSWLVEEGARIEMGEEILEIENEKAVGAYDSPAAGILRRRVVSAGETVPVGALLGVIADAATTDDRIDDFVQRFQQNARGLGVG